MPKFRPDFDVNMPWLNGWVVTYNTNRPEKEFIPIVLQAWNELLPNLVQYVRTYSSPTVEIINGSHSDVIEVSPKYHRIHLHSNLRLESKGLAMLNFNDPDRSGNDMATFMDDRVRELWEEKYSEDLNYKPYSRGYLNGQVVKNLNAERLIKAYLEKAPVKALPIRPGKVVREPLANAPITFEEESNF